MEDRSINVENKVLELVDASQKSTACHQKNCMQLSKVYEQMEMETFWEVLEKVLRIILRVDFKEKNLFYDRMIDFLGKFCGVLLRAQISNDGKNGNHPLVTRLFKYLLKSSSHPSDIVRFRSCQLINKITEYLVDCCEISEEFWNDFVDMLSERLIDTKGIVRLQAILALYRFQDPSDLNHPLIANFIHLLSDSQAKIRQLSVEKIAPNRAVISHIVKRTRDVDFKVRLAAFKRLSSLVKVIKIVHRRTILFNGIYDRSEKVQEYVLQELLPSWFKCYDYNIMALLQSCRLDGDDKDIELTNDLYEFILNRFFFKCKEPKEILEVVHMSGEKLIPYEELNWESSAYWRLLISQSCSGNSSLQPFEDEFIPEAVFFCQYVKSFIERNLNSDKDKYLEEQYIVLQLFGILKVLDWSDPHSLRSVRSLIEFALKNGDLLDSVIEEVFVLTEKFIPDQDARCRFGMEIISDLQCPVDDLEEQRKQQERELLLAELKVKLEQMKDEQDIAIKSSDFVEAERLKNQMEDLTIEITNIKSMLFSAVQKEPERRTDRQTNLKCLNIAWAILRSANVTYLTPSLRSFKNEFLHAMLCYDNNLVKLKALQCFSLCCLYDKHTAQQGIHLFAVPISAYQAGEECCTQTLITCVEAVSDLLRIYGSDLLAEPRPDQSTDSVNEEHEMIFAGGTSLTALYQGLVDLMDDENNEIRLKACTGLSKLVLGERINSPSIICKLILKWCNPADEGEEDQSLKQLVGHVLEKLPRLPNGAEQLEGAVLPTLRTLINAPSSSPLAAVNIDNIIHFMVALCKTSPKSASIQSNLALDLCHKIQRSPDNRVNGILSKVLLMLEVPEDRDILEELFALGDEVREYSSDRTTIKNLTKYLSKLSELLGGIKDVSIIDEEQYVLTTSSEDEDSAHQQSSS